MNIMLAIIVLVLLAVLALASYVERIYTEMGRFLSRDFQQNIEAYEEKVVPRLGRVAGRAQLTMSTLTQLCTALVSMIILYIVVADGHWSGAEISQAVLAVILVIIIFNRFLPFVFFTRTDGAWLVRLAPVLKTLIYLLLPITLALNFTLSVAALGEHHGDAPEHSSDAVEALIEAGQEEGILEESDRELIHSVVEFGDKTVREVMTPRPDLFAIPISTTIEAFTEMLREHPYSRVPVFEDTVDNMKGIVFAHDVLQVSDVEARTRTVAALMKPAFFVPENKRVQELLREMQKSQLHMAIVIDEYGSVAGVVTIEDMLEEIVGEIADEHEPRLDVFREPDGSYILNGNVDLGRLEDVFGFRPDHVESTTVGGLISETVGRIPRAGEVIEQEGLRFEILDSTDRRIERVRVSRDIEQRPRVRA